MVSRRPKEKGIPKAKLMPSMPHHSIHHRVISRVRCFFLASNTHDHHTKTYEMRGIGEGQGDRDDGDRADA